MNFAISPPYKSKRFVVIYHGKEMNSIQRKAYMARMRDDFYWIVLDLAEEHHITLQELYVQKGERPFWHALTRELNDTQEFEGATHELKDLTEGKVKFSVKRYFGRLLGFHQLREERRMRRAIAAH